MIQTASTTCQSCFGSLEVTVQAFTIKTVDLATCMVTTLLCLWYAHDELPSFSEEEGARARHCTGQPFAGQRRVQALQEIVPLVSLPMLRSGVSM